MTSHIDQISEWFRTAKGDNINDRTLNVQTGVHFEEVAEMLGTVEGVDEKSQAAVNDALRALEAIAEGLKNGSLGVRVTDRVELLDSLCDQVVTATGIGYEIGCDFSSALREVADSNDSKFDDEGKAIFNENGKIIKGPRYFRPQLNGFFSAPSAVPTQE